ncbi:hypothetical protein Mp_1g27730 [Marchantia polymorpha subsp. ruderalis]|uniref:Uncharacterized protein n=2 Tax=Marchantia polymorpha TaxID=3197 RepID=A0AAF6AUY7_MARPO|nr:hypothetical protein MARPO_0002s0105 [Marchantia polymorpha]BBN00258.1 hypothetical protein Mp_1g27730 [Marchantia polymorpha subsp. ruderalis]|eukprot:PTQ49624.1 hypothetical protein MARPO_0002s0105 [Marchantia polymorpha]
MYTRKGAWARLLAAIVKQDGSTTLFLVRLRSAVCKGVMPVRQTREYGVLQKSLWTGKGDEHHRAPKAGCWPRGEMLQTSESQESLCHQAARERHQCV